MNTHVWDPILYGQGRYAKIAQLKIQVTLLNTEFFNGPPLNITR